MVYLELVDYAPEAPAAPARRREPEAAPVEAET
jgi:hypothetical protein